MRAKTNGGAKRAVKKSPSRGGPRGNGSKRGRSGNGARNASEREIAEMFGFTPEFFDAVPPTVLQHAWGIMRDFQLKETSLSPKSKELIGLALAAHMKCKYCTYFHTEAARFHGATDEELCEAATMGGYTAMMSNAVTGAQIDYDHFTEEVDRAFEHLRNKSKKAPSRTARARA